MVELLAVIVIIGVLSTIAVIATVSIRGKMEESYYGSQVDLVTVAGKDYYGDHRELLPVNNGEKSEVLLETLVKEKYIDPVYSYDKKLCATENKEDIKVTVVKEDTGKYRYNTIFVCGDYVQGKEDATGPVILFFPNKNVTARKLKALIRVKDNDGGSGLLYYNYRIIKDGLLYKEVNENKVEEMTIDLQEAGSYQIEAEAFDVSGNKSTKVSPIYTLHQTPPEAPDIVIEPTVWTNQRVKANILPKEGTVKIWCYKEGETEARDCTKNPQIIEFNTTLYARGEDAYGNRSEVTSIVISNIDKVGPRATFDPSTGETLGMINISISDGPNESGASHFRYAVSTDNGKTWSDFTDIFGVSGTTNIEAVSSAVKIKVQAYDQAGNMRETISNTYNVLDRKPSVPSISSSNTGSSCTSSVTITISCPSDPQGGSAVCSYHTGNGVWQNYTGPFTISSNVTISARAMSKLGYASDITTFGVNNICTSSGGDSGGYEIGGWDSCRYDCCWACPGGGGMCC